MVKGSKAEELEAKGLYRRAASRAGCLRWRQPTSFTRE